MPSVWVKGAAAAGPARLWCSSCSEPERLPAAVVRGVQHGQYMYPLDTIRSRAASADEGADYLRSPAFSNCTVPVVWYPFW
jgi:hypothetical protein